MKLAFALAALVATTSIAASIAAPVALAKKPAVPLPPTKQAALDVLTAWVKAQNDGDLAGYVGVYGRAFVGVKRTTDGGQKTYTLAAWKADRAKMFKAPQKVTAEGASVVIKDTHAIIHFVQRYQSGGYADHGDKELVVESGVAGDLTIVREEMLYSAPGWDADPKAELDATALAPPITARVRQQAINPGQVGDCAGVSYTLELADAKHKKQKVDIGSGNLMVDKAIVFFDADPTADKLFEFGQWCAGGADYYQIVKDGDALVVRYKGEDEGSPDEVQPPATWETRLTVRLPAGATIK